MRPQVCRGGVVKARWKADNDNHLMETPIFHGFFNTQSDLHRFSVWMVAKYC